MLISGVILAGTVESKALNLFRHRSGILVFERNVAFIWEYLSAREQWAPLPYNDEGKTFTLPQLVFSLPTVRVCLTAVSDIDIKYQVETFL